MRSTGLLEAMVGVVCIGAVGCIDAEQASSNSTSPAELAGQVESATTDLQCLVPMTTHGDHRGGARCGDGHVGWGETCDPPWRCPRSCDDGDVCTTDIRSGSPLACNVFCRHIPISACVSGDSCCPGGCDNTNDTDCAPSCGNGVLEAAETCDPPSACPANCDDGIACTVDTQTGGAETCDLVCGHVEISACAAGDGCCPVGCNANNDTDCLPSCGNGVVESGETCDPPSSCPTGCDDGNACTDDSILQGSQNECNVVCQHVQTSSCVSGDGCCASGCNANNDTDCSSTCGNWVVEPGETCDPPVKCPSCDDGNRCTADHETGSASTCNSMCAHTVIDTCVSGDGCCPPGCDPASDSDCCQGAVLFRDADGDGYGDSNLPTTGMGTV
jgi:hypothetical protein